MIDDDDDDGCKKKYCLFWVTTKRKTCRQGGGHCPNSRKGQDENPAHQGLDIELTNKQNMKILVAILSVVLSIVSCLPGGVADGENG